MKKLVSVLIGLVIVCAAASSVSAADYEVQKGDSLWKIANENKTTVEILMEINELESSLIYPKQVLKVNQEESKSYIVQKGDTLTDISNVYGDQVTVEKLKEWNNLSSNLIITGESLIVNGEGDELAVNKAVEQTDEDQVKEPEVVEEVIASSEEVSEPGVETAEANTEIEEEKTETTEKDVNETTTEEVQGKTFAVESTAYTAGCSGCSGITATGINLNNDPYAKVIAVDPNVIPLGTQVYVEGYGNAVAGDTGGAIKGNKIDIHLPTKDEARNWGRKTVNITIIE